MSGSCFSEVPLRLEARPAAGFELSHWIINGQSLHADSLAGSILEFSMSSDSFIEPVFIPSGTAFPIPFELKGADYVFSYWDRNAISGHFPDHMAFVYMDEIEPGLSANIAGFTSGYYNLEERTRINGHGENGFSFINTSNTDGNPGYPGRRLGGALLALDTRNVSDVWVEWSGGTVIPNSRAYNIRLQYRIGDEGEFKAVTNPDGSPVEYQRKEQAGHLQALGPIRLPEEAIHQDMVQLFWRYYFSGIRHNDDSGARSMLNIPFIRVTESAPVGLKSDDLPKQIALQQNYPNPFNSNTNIEFTLPYRSNVTLTIHDITGRHVQTLLDQSDMAAGIHNTIWNANDFASGIYIYRLQVGNFSVHRRMTLIK